MLTCLEQSTTALCTNQCVPQGVGNSEDSDERHLYTLGILIWHYRVILTLGNSEIEFCNKTGHGHAPLL